MLPQSEIKSHRTQCHAFVDIDEEDNIRPVARRAGVCVYGVYLHPPQELRIFITLCTQSRICSSGVYR